MAGLVAEQADIPHNLQCFPVFSLLAALDLPTINLFSLDIEGAEFQVSQQIKFLLDDCKNAGCRC